MLLWKDGKGPNEDANFDVDWTEQLNGDTISNSTWSIVGCDGPVESPITLTIVSNSYTNTMTEVWLSGGALPYNYILQNQVWTFGGEDPLTRKILLPMRNR